MAQLRVLTFNVFFDPVAQQLRHREILSIAARSRAHVVLFQEVTLPFIRELQRTDWVQRDYRCSDADFSGDSVRPYGVCTLARRDLNPHFATFPMPTHMGRSLLVTSITLPPTSPLNPTPSPARALIGNVHLESLANHPTRVRQLQVCHAVLTRYDQAVSAAREEEGLASKQGRQAFWDKLLKSSAAAPVLNLPAFNPDSKDRGGGEGGGGGTAGTHTAAAFSTPLVILAGDFNFCSYRNFDGTLPLENDALAPTLPGWQDVWPTLRDTAKEPGYTFDTMRNTFTEAMGRGRYECMRYDRVMARCPAQGGWAATDIRLVGTEEIAQGCTTGATSQGLPANMGTAIGQDAVGQVQMAAPSDATARREAGADAGTGAGSGARTGAEATGGPGAGVGSPTQGQQEGKKEEPHTPPHAVRKTTWLHVSVDCPPAQVFPSDHFGLLATFSHMGQR